MTSFYTPHFFSMSLAGEYDNDYSKMPQSDLGIFVHEYAHYLQNLTTVFGLRWSQLYYESLREAKEYIVANEKLTLPLPSTARLNATTYRGLNT